MNDPITSQRDDADTLLVVIVNFRTAELVVDCLASLAGEIGTPRAFRVVVTDNASGDGSVERLDRTIHEQGWEGWATVRPLARNGGFAWGNNEAIRPALASEAPPRYVLLLNPDTVVRPGALAALVAFMDDRPEVGIAGSRLEDPDGTAQWSAFRFHSVLGELGDGLRLAAADRLLARWRVAAPPPPGPSPCPTDWVAGASMIVRREVFESIGLLDDKYFMYYEEADFCLRARRAGWPCWYVPAARVVHLVGQSSGVTDRRAAGRRLPAYWFRARRHYFLSNHGPAKTVLADLAWLCGFASYRLRRALVRRPDPAPERVLVDFIRHNFHLPVFGR
ncbi:MAG: glycosyltransferase family 2 protein [Isosphaeraceae bacterium]|nr:glycosyltransferase family 2 protein [Isosphaeraceae bacterium]